MTLADKIAIAATAAGYDADDAIITYETFADFDTSARTSWVAGSYNEDNSEAFPIRNYSGVQIRKGPTRYSCFTLIDCGDFRVIFGGQ
jgi:hypothetical protein